MISEGFLKAARPLAQHSTRLATRAPEPAELAVGLAAMGKRLERILVDALEPLLGDEKVQVTVGKVETLLPMRLHKIVDLVAVNYLLGDAHTGQLLASLDLGSALALTDLVFGGAGEAPAHLPERLPASTDRTLGYFAQALGEALGEAFERPAALPLVKRSDVLGKLVPARDEEPLFLMRCPIARDNCEPWELLLVVRQSQALRFVGEGRPAAPKPAAGQRSPMREPFAKMPLSVRAVLVDMAVPVSRISALRPGDTIPIAIGRDVPLNLDSIEVARGQVGASDGKLALRLTRIAANTKDNAHD